MELVPPSLPHTPRHARHTHSHHRPTLLNARPSCCLSREGSRETVQLSGRLLPDGQRQPGTSPAAARPPRPRGPLRRLPKGRSDGGSWEKQQPAFQLQTQRELLLKFRQLLPPKATVLRRHALRILS